MSNTILPNAICFLTMTDDELRDELSKGIYNSANSHEMIRRLVKLGRILAEERVDAIDKMAEYREAVDEIKSTVDDLHLE